MLRRNWLHILVSLAERELHGSAIAEDVLERTEGELRLWPATLYRALDELVEAGFVEEVRGADRPKGGSPRRRYYRVTPDGRQALSDEVRSLETLAQQARIRLGDAG